MKTRPSSLHVAYSPEFNERAIICLTRFIRGFGIIPETVTLFLLAIKPDNTFRILLTNFSDKKIK